ncbi:MAG: protein kinase domain-containing protein [Candidatus Hodarchaeales archaeon]|jgi:serine/threonine protein kinase
MMRLIKINMFDDKSFMVSYRNFERIGAGGQGAVYKFTYNKRMYALKAIPDEQSIFRRLKNMRSRFINSTHEVPSSVMYRSLPIGQGYAPGKIFDFKTVKDLYLLLFNWVEGQSLFDYLTNERVLSKKRKNIVKKVLELLVYLQRNLIIHNDLYPDNLLVDKKKNIFLIDLEGAGIIHKEKWLWQPLVIGKEFMFPAATEVRNPINNKPSRFSDRWVGLYLVFWILNGFHPFPFLNRIDHEALNMLVKACDNNTIKWPPSITDIKLIKPYLNQKYSFNTFKNFMETYYGNTNFERILFQTFISGYDNPQKRIEFELVQNSLKSIL